MNNTLLLTRRNTLKAIAAASALGLTACRQQKSATSEDIIFSAQGQDNDHYALSWFSQQQDARSALSGFRGHGAAQHPTEPWRVVMFARRPGLYAIEVDLRSGQVFHTIQSPEGHHMHGHGAFSADGQWMFSTESDYRSGEGKVLIRDTRDYRLVGEYLTHGIGPHQMMLMPDLQTLVVANGGLRTHPDSGRKILNSESMDSSLVYLDAATGTVTGQYRVPEAKASIRHLDVAHDGTVVIATQIQRDAMNNDDIIPLAAVHRPATEQLTLLQAPSGLLHQFNDYMGSVAISQTERVAGFTSPRGNIAAFWHIDSGELLGYHAFHDVCGLTTTDAGRAFVLSNSAGEVRYLSALSLQEDRSRRRQFAGKHWDNHMFTFTMNAKFA